MPPKKKKAPIVVGTVSTRSTRRESVVNIDIPKGPKVGKSPVRSPVPKKSIKKQEKELLSVSSESLDITQDVDLDMTQPLASSPKIESNALVSELENSANSENIEIHKEAADDDKPNQYEQVIMDAESVIDAEVEPVAKTEVVATEEVTNTVEAKRDPCSSTNEPEEVEMQEPEPTRPEILELLKDWSDEESSEGSVKSMPKKTLAKDKQCLIDILEGSGSDAEPAFEGLKPAKRVQELKMEENPVAGIESPKSDEPDIIEECVVEDNSIIIEFSDENSQGSAKDCTSKMEVDEAPKGDISVVQASNHSEDSSNNYEIEHIICESSKSSDDSKMSEREDKLTSKVIKVSDTSVEIQFILSNKKEEQFKVETVETSKGADAQPSDKLEEAISRMTISPKTLEMKEEPEGFILGTPVTKPKKNRSSSQRRKSLRNKSDSNISSEPPVQVDKPTFEQTLELISKKTGKTKLKEPMDCTTVPEKSFAVDEEGSTSSESVKELKSSPLIGTSRAKTPERDMSLVMETSINKKSPKIFKSKLDEATSLEIDATINEVLRKYTVKNYEKEPKAKFKDSKKKKDKFKKEYAEFSEEVRRSDRIKTIIPIKKKSHGLVKSKSEPYLPDLDTSDSNSNTMDIDQPTPTVSPQLSKADKKLKSKSAESLQVDKVPSPDLPKPMDIKADKTGQAEIEARLKTFVHLKENQYKTDRQICKEAREMICDCYLAEEDIQKDEYGCGEDCLNRLLMIECGELCQVRDRCTNKKFQKNQFAPVEVFKTDKKGLGLRAAANIAYGEFILEYVGEVLDPDEFDNRAEVYSKDKNIHFYFMSLRADAIIDATMKGNISRFINHSCDPNAETQKWTVNGELRIGFFSTRTILAGEEITFDYHFQRYGKEAQKCYCEATICRGWLGERPDESEDEEEEEEDEEPSKVEPAKVEAVVPVPEKLVLGENVEKMATDEAAAAQIEVKVEEQPAAETKEPSKKASKKKARKEILYEDFDQLNEDIEMLLTTGLKNQAHTLKLSRLMVRAKDLEHRKKLLRVLRRGEVACRRLFLDYHGLRLMHGYMIDAQSSRGDIKTTSTKLDVIQTKLELLQTLAVLPIQNKTMLIESKVLPTVEKWSKNEDILEDGDQKDVKKSPESDDPAVKEKVDEIKFLAANLLQEWVNLKEIFRIPKKQRIEQMKEHEKEANRKFLESSYAQEKESSRKNDQRYRTWSRYKSERETNRKNRHEDKDKPSAEFLKISKHERRKLFALQMELKEEERRLKQREIWRQHEMNCMMIGADPRFTAPFDPGKGFQYIWNPAIGQWQALPVPQSITGPVPGNCSNFTVPTHKPPPPIPFPYHPGSSASQFSGFPVIPTSIPAPIPSQIPGIASTVTSTALPPPIIPGPVHGLPTIPGINQLNTLPVFPEIKEEDPSQVKFAGPIPPPAKLPPKWKCAKDKYGRPYYYHVKIRNSQWEPPPYVVEPESSESSSSESSTVSSTDSSSDSDSDDELDDSRLLSDVKKNVMESGSKLKALPDFIKQEYKDSVSPSPDIKMESDNEFEPGQQVEPLNSLDLRLKEQFNLDGDEPPKKKRRVGLCQEIIISPRTEEDHKQFKKDMKRYKATKEKLKKQKEQMLLSKKKQKLMKERKLVKNPAKTRIKEMKEWNDEHAKKIKEVFRTTMATTVVSVLNFYRKPDCKIGRIANTEDFKHLARKLTHFVMLKEIKHLSSINELVCTDNVKGKAREYIRKYMSKFGELYQKRHDEPDFKD